MLRLSRLLLAVMIGSLPAGAAAAWHEAKSRHFVIYADEKPKALLDYATRLEKFDAAVRAIMQLSDPPVGDGNRLTIFVMPSDDDVRKLAGDASGFLSGFYTGRASGPLAYVGKNSKSDAGIETILFHEYAHHLMMQQLDHAYPEWYVEGFAEFLSVPKFDRDGSVGLGAPAKHRAWGLFEGKPLSAESLLGGTYGDLTKFSKEQRDVLYGRSWLLAHYLFMETARAGQLSKYISAVSRGTPQLDAARHAFGDLAQLDKELAAYLERKRLTYINVEASRLQIAPIDVRPLSEGASEVILLRAKVKNGAGASEKGPLAAEVRRVQARFPGDELVELTLAEAELNANRHEVAEAAADRALKANPRNGEAMILKGRAIVERAVEADGDSSALFDQARDLFIAANKIDPEDPEPLMEFYKAFVRAGQRPTANAIAALHYASDLAPQDLGLRINSARAYLNEGKPSKARAALVPVAYSPHGGEAAAVAKSMIARIDAGAEKGPNQAAINKDKDQQGQINSAIKSPGPAGALPSLPSRPPAAGACGRDRRHSRPGCRPSE